MRCGDRRSKCSNIISLEASLKTWKIFVGICVTLFIVASGYTANEVNKLSDKHESDIHMLLAENKSLLAAISENLSDNKVAHAEIKKDIERLGEKVDDSTSVAAFTQNLVKQLMRDKQ
jgi:hypothetical protein